jgi:hypothetical protein
LIDLVFERLGHIVADELEVGVFQQVCDVAFAAREEIIHADDFVSFAEKSFTQVGAQKACSAGN